METSLQKSNKSQCSAITIRSTVFRAGKAGFCAACTAGHALHKLPWGPIHPESGTRGIRQLQRDGPTQEATSRWGAHVQEEAQRYKRIEGIRIRA